MSKFFTLCLLLTIVVAGAQPAPSATSADIYLQLKRLNVLGSVLYVAAHPDDENTRLLTYFSKDRLYRTGYLSLTRGDGGQNLIGDEQGILLGLIRTQELLAARRVDGAEQFFTRAYDFGFSKKPEETFTKWNREKILADVVWTIRKFQPDVIITRFPTTGEGGHGHHTASAILANEAFTAAADPKRFPEQLQWVQPWQAKRIVWNTFNFGNNNTQRPDQFRFDVGGYNSILGKSYGEIAAESRSQHKSQGFGVAAGRGEALEFFSTTGGTAPVNDIMDDVKADWERVEGGILIAPLVQNTIAAYDFREPQKSLPQLLQIYKAISKLPKGYWRSVKLSETEQLIALCSGLWMEAATTVPNAVQGDSLRVMLTVNNRSGSNLQLSKISVEGFDTSFNKTLEQNRNLTITKTLLVPSGKPLSQPYWLKAKMEEGMFRIDNQELIGLPQGAPSYTATFEIKLEDETFRFTRPVQYKHTDPVKGEIYQPLFVLPPASITSTPDLIIFPKGKKVIKDVAVELNAHKKLDAPNINIDLRSSQFYASKKDSLIAVEKGTKRAYYFKLHSDKIKPGTDVLKAIAHFKKEDKNAYLAMSGIHYDHIPEIRYYYSDDIKLLNIDLKTAGRRIGYIPGAGDKVPGALEQMGYEVSLLTDKELSQNNLSRFDAIITGVRAYNTNEWLNNHYERLMSYVQNGGNLIVQYNTSTQIGPVRAKMGPYQFNISRNRITDENAAVRFLKPDHAVLNFPNKITAEDFKDWVQERSIYHAADADPAFEAILSMSDPDEEPHNGSLIVAKYGKGYFTYTGLVFFRELPAGVPGAYRLFANLIALNAQKTF